MKAPMTKWIPIEEAKIDEEYFGYTSTLEPNSTNYCSVIYKGNGVGWVFNNEERAAHNIDKLMRYLTFQETNQWYEDNYKLTPTAINNLYGLFNDMSSVGDACHELWNGWIDSNWYEMSLTLEEENFWLVGVARAPYKWTVGGDCIAFVAEYYDTGERFWCHGSTSWVEDMREQMKEIYDGLVETTT